MPTPFTHLEIAQRLLIDTDLPALYREYLASYLSNFQLGSIVADARVSSGIGREFTHFYAYDVPMTDHPWRIMLTQHPSLQHPRNLPHLAFIAGYVAHLATDEAWALKMMRPNFGGKHWEGVSRKDKFIALHLLLTYMDERDESQLEAWQAESLHNCQPDNWLPFMLDDILIGWRDLIYQQIVPDGDSQTLHIFGQRLGVEPAFLRGLLDNENEMQHRLWRHIPPAQLQQIETILYAFTRHQLHQFLIQYLPVVDT